MNTGTKSKQRTLAALLSLALAAGMLLTGCSQASPAAPSGTASPVLMPEPTAALYPDRRDAKAEFDKEETVYGKADATGKLRSVTVENVLNYPGVNGQVEDFTRLREIKNTEGDEEFSLGQGGLLYWEDHGEKIRYEGRSDEALPVGVKISYFLDGKPISPKQLAGKSGRLRMRFDYENHSSGRFEGLRKNDSAAPETCVPFLALSVVLLPEEVFRSVKATEGRLLSLGNQSVFLGYAFPGVEEALKLEDYRLTEELQLPAYAELEADVENFSLDFTATIFSNSLLRELEEKDLDDLDNFADSTADFLDALTKLSEGADALADGSRSLDTALEGYTGGVHSLAQGAKSLSDALSGLSGQLPAAQGPLDSLLELLSGVQLDSAGEALDLLIAYLEQLQAQLQSMQGYPAQVGSAVDAAQESIGQIYGEAAEALAETALDTQEQQQILARIDARVSAAQSALDAVADTPGGADFSQRLGELYEAAEALRRAALDLRASPDQLHQLDEALRGAKELFAALSRLAGNAGTLSEAAIQLSDAGPKLLKAIAALSDGANVLADGLSEFKREGSEELDALGGEKLRALVTRLRAMRQADIDYESFSGAAPGRSCSVRFIIETEPIE